jgi:colanic acid/amylovoran biosynthesis protein
MILYDTCIKAFIKGNLGDDLFIHTLCDRYPEVNFVTCGEKKYKRLFSEIRNLRYISTDSFFLKWMIRGINLPIWICNKIFRKEIFSMHRFFDFVSAHSRYNVYIAGSVFMELGDGRFLESPYLKKERKYYERNPVVIGCNFGPYHNEEYKDFYIKCFEKATQVCVRDTYSYNLLGSKTVDYAPDILFTYNQKGNVSEQRQDYVLISVMNLLKDGNEDKNVLENYEKAIIYFIKQLLERNEKVVLVGFCNEQQDNLIIDKILRIFHQDRRVASYAYPDVSKQQIINLISNAKAVVATRYHAMILGWLYNKNVLPIVYSKKMSNVIEDIIPELPYIPVNQLKGREKDLFKVYTSIMRDDIRPDIIHLREQAQNNFKKLDEIYRYGGKESDRKNKTVFHKLG